MHDFLSEHGHSLAAKLEDHTWLAHLAYLTDVFGHLNELNTSLHSTDKTVLQMYDKVSAFMRKTDLWLRRCEKGDVSNFPQLNSWIADMTQNMKQNILKTVKMHLAKLTAEFESYFPDTEDKSPRLDWIRRLFMHSSMDIAPEQLHESLIDLSSDSGFRLKFSETSLTQFWCCVEREYPELAKEALYQLQPFGSTYLCEVTFSALTHIKTKQRNRLQLERSIITAVATIHPRLQKLMSGRQVQVSY